METNVKMRSNYFCPKLHEIVLTVRSNDDTNVKPNEINHQVQENCFHMSTFGSKLLLVIVLKWNDGNAFKSKIYHEMNKCEVLQIVIFVQKYIGLCCEI